MATTTKTKNRLTFINIVKIQKEVLTHPGFDVRMKQDMQDGLRQITNSYMKSVGADGVPNDIIINDRIPLPDMYLKKVKVLNDGAGHMTEIEDVRCRVLIFNRINSSKTNLPKKDDFVIMGAIIVDYALAFPMRLFGIRQGSNNIEILDEMYWFGLHKLENIHECEKMYKGKYPTIEYMYEILGYWYGCQKVALSKHKNELCERLWKILDHSRVRWLNDMIKRYPTKLKYDKKTSRGAKVFSPSIQSWPHTGYMMTDKNGDEHYIPGKRHYRKQYSEFETKGLVDD